MKTLVCLLAGVVLTSFVNRPMEDELDGFWLGYYRNEVVKEKVIIKLTNEDKMEYYTGGIDDLKKIEGTYKIYGDSVSFYYQTPEGEKILMQGHFNYRRNAMDGICRTNDKPSGSFYLEKQKVQELFVAP
jgi:hypothetical protein